METTHKIKSVSRKLIAQIVCLSVVACSSLGSLAYISSTKAIDSSIRQDLKSNAQNKALHLQLKFNDYISGVQMIASDERMKSMDWDKQLPLMLEKIKENNYSGMAVTNLDGDLHIFNGNKANVKDAPFFDTVINKQQTIVIPPMLDFADSTRTLVPMGVPIISNEGKPLGMLTADQNATFINTIIDDIKQGQTGYAFILNKDDGSFIADNKDHRNYAQEKLNIKDEYKDETIVKLYDEAFKSPYGFITYEENGKTQYVAYSEVQGSSWYLFVKVPAYEVQGLMRSISTILIIMTLVCVILSIFVALWIASGIRKPLESISVYAKELANNNLSYRLNIKTKDEFGQVSDLLNEAMESLQRVVTSVKTAENEANKLTSLTEQKVDNANAQIQSISAEVVEISASMEESASSVEQITSKMANMKDYGNEISNKAQESVIIANTIRERASKVIKDSEVVKEQVISVYETSKDKLDKATSKVEVVKSIGDMARKINNIAEQTNLLSLNASIEAARAGEHGRGFSVVADEVRKLAEQSSNTASDIQKIITNVVSSVEELTQTSKSVLESMKEAMNSNHEKIMNISDEYNNSGEIMKDIMDEFDNGTKQISESLEEITNNVSDLQNTIANVTTASREIASEISNINDEMEVITLASKDSAEVSEKLSSMVSQFTTE